MYALERFLKGQLLAVLRHSTADNSPIRIQRLIKNDKSPIKKMARNR
jgi:hypothetical protein